MTAIGVTVAASAVATLLAAPAIGIVPDGTIIAQLITKSKSVLDRVKDTYKIKPVPAKT